MRKKKIWVYGVANPCGYQTYVALYMNKKDAKEHIERHQKAIGCYAEFYYIEKLEVLQEPQEIHYTYCNEQTKRLSR
jgi:hypothetical protein